MSDVDFQEITKYKWYWSRNYARHNKLGMMHRFILERMLKSKIPSGFQVDHKNGDKLDNRRSNLRICTQAQNIANRKGNTNKWGYKGVLRHRNKRLFSARIQVDGKRIHIGLYQTIKEAAIAYNKAAKKYHGKFAYKNEII